MQPISQVLLSIDAPLQDELITDSGLKFYIDPTYRKEHQATVVAKIAALPIKVNPKHRNIFDKIKIGDTVALSYRVVADFTFESDSPRFMPVTEENAHTREYVNGKGEWLKVYALPGKISKIWVGVLQDRRKEVISGVQGTESEMERWLAQFPIGKTDIYTFNNLFNYEGTDYWKCDLDDIFAIKEKGHWVAIGDRVICKFVEDKVPDSVLIGEHKGLEVKMRYQDRGRIMSGGKSRGCKKDEIVSFNPRYLEKYEFESKEYYLIREDFINGKWN